MNYSEKKIREAFSGLDGLAELDVHMDLSRPRHNVSPTDAVPVVHRDDGHLRLDGMIWGTRDDKSVAKRPILLVRAESVTRGSLASRARGLVMFTKFYEWQGEKGTKRKPYAVESLDGHILALAALCKRSITSDGEVRESCTIVTQPAMGPLVEIHDRMPVLVAREHLATWLDPSTKTDAALGLVRTAQAATADALHAFAEDPYRL